ncbi:MAG: alpha/beta fold hydrolase [Actinomycetota bacterium]|nr:alpha/beta fold hydrolase [Actinomycetota bacterium]
MRITTNDGVGLAVDRAGTGPGLLLIHGFGGAKEDFGDHVEALARDHTVVIFDHRGHGASDKPEDQAAYSLDRLVADTLDVADALGLDRFRLLGHSMGGMVARRLVLEHPDRVEALILMDTAPGPIAGLPADDLELASAIMLAEGKAVLKPLLDERAVLDTPAYRQMLLDRPGYGEFCDRKWDDLSAVMWGTLVLEILRQPDDRARLGEITVPTMVLVGEQDKPLVKPSREMAELIPGAQLVVIPDGGHSPQFENPDAWIAAVQAFLGSLVKT